MSDLFNLRGKVAVVTDGARGLGLAAADALGKAGASLVITARKQDELDAASHRLRFSGHDVLAVRYDATRYSEAASVVDGILSKLGRIDVLVNNAGATCDPPAADHPPGTWIKIVDVNLNGTWTFAQAVAAKSMIPRRQGIVVIVAPVVGLGDNLHESGPTAAYSASKMALINLTRLLAVEWGEYGIRVNALLPGWFAIKIAEKNSRASVKNCEGRIPLRRFGKCEDIAGPILFLTSEASHYVTGQILAVDGGLSAV